MKNNYNYYPNSYDRMNYDEFIKSLGIDNMNINSNVNTSFNNINSNTSTSNQLYGSYEGYMKGNMFKDLYHGYKNYQPAQLIPKSEEEEALLNLNQMAFAMHEANLYLDVYPDDANMMRSYTNFRNNYNRLLEDYEKKYDALNVNSSELNQVPFGWEEQIWPWDRRGL